MYSRWSICRRARRRRCLVNSPFLTRPLIYAPRYLAKEDFHYRPASRRVSSAGILADNARERARGRAGIIFNDVVARCRARNRAFYYHGVVKVTILASSYHRALFYSSAVAPRDSTACTHFYRRSLRFEHRCNARAVSAFMHRFVCVCVCTRIYVIARAFYARSSKFLAEELYSGISPLLVALSLLLSSFLMISASPRAHDALTQVQSGRVQFL